MKYLIVVLVVVVVVAWLLLRDRPKKTMRNTHSAPTEALPQAMVQCKHCGVHLPRGDALLDTRGAFCTEAHRLAGAHEP